MGTIMLVVFFDTVYKKFWIFPEIFRVEGRTVIIVSFSEGYMFSKSLGFTNHVR